jgi:hypothetical protein
VYVTRPSAPNLSRSNPKLLVTGPVVTAVARFEPGRTKPILRFLERVAYARGVRLNIGFTPNAGAG